MADPADRLDQHRVTRPYRIGWWTHSWWPTRRLLLGLATGKQPSSRAPGGKRFVGRARFAKLILRRLRSIRRPHRPWQAEADGGWFARRALSPAAAERKIIADVEHSHRHGLPSPYQYWQLRRRSHSGVQREAPRG